MATHFSLIYVIRYQIIRIRGRGGAWKLHIYKSRNWIYRLDIRTRDGWKCKRCGKHYPPPTTALHCSHFWGRGRENTRIDEKNCDAICFHCHQFFHANPAEYREWKLKQLGEREYRVLEIRAHLTKKKDIKMNLLIIEQLLKDENE